MPIQFFNSYQELGGEFYESVKPISVRKPQLFLWNSELADELEIPAEIVADRHMMAQIFSGNHILPGSEPLALVYAGHQFGSFVPRLGDGRAHLLGEVQGRSGRLYDIQLKGSGPTSFSRGGDGRCAFGPALREFIMSEALAALRVPTTRSLAVVTTDEDVYRETILPGAVLTRVAASHLRIGTFEYFAYRQDFNALSRLCDYAIQRHYPTIDIANPMRYLEFLEQLQERLISLVVEWLRIGFIHGVMNTDNTSISGETLDFGPCAMMSRYDPNTVYSSIDRFGRYAFGNQGKVLNWNLARLAEAIWPLIDSDPKRATSALEPVLSTFQEQFQKYYLTMMKKKLGLESIRLKDDTIIASLLEQMSLNHLDYTITFDRLTSSLNSQIVTDELTNELGDWFLEWQALISVSPDNREVIQESMRRENPVVIPRNHHVEAILSECESSGEPEAAETFLKVIRSPYRELNDTANFQDAPADGDLNYKTFCGT